MGLGLAVAVTTPADVTAVGLDRPVAVALFFEGSSNEERHLAGVVVVGIRSV